MLHDNSRVSIPRSVSGPELTRDRQEPMPPVIDRNRCEAKGPCTRVCPHDVFEIRALGEAERAALSLKGRLKAWAHGWEQAFVARPDACQACGKCVVACPEQAIRL